MNDNRKIFAWDLCYTCNYKCEYCNVWNIKYNDKIETNLDKWMRAWNRVCDLYGKCEIEISGGEPATHPNFIEIITQLTEKHFVHICTNLSWDVHQLVPKLSLQQLHISATYHPLNAEFEEFFDKVVSIKEYCQSIDYVAIPGKIDELIERKERFEKNGIRLFALPLRSPDAKYSLNSTEEKNEINNICCGNKKESEELQYLMLNTSPKGKQCRTGKDYVCLRPNGHVDRCPHCKGEELGSFFDSDFKLNDKPMPCEQVHCFIPFYFA